MYTITEDDYKNYFQVTEVPQPFLPLIDESKVIILSKTGVDVDMLTLEEPCLTRIKNLILLQTEFLKRYIENGGDSGMIASYVGIGEFLYSMKRDSTYNKFNDIISPRVLDGLQSCGLYKKYKKISWTVF